MPETTSLPYRSLVENRCHSLYEVIVVCRLSNDDALFLRLTNLAAYSRLDLMIPPVLVALRGQNSNLVQLLMEGESRRHVWQALPECEHVRLEVLIFKDRDHCFWITYIFVPFVLECDHRQWPSGNSIDLAEDIETLDLAWLALDQRVLTECVEWSERG